MADWIRPDWPAPARVAALVTTRAGGASEGAYAGLNLGTHVGDDAQRVAENRRRLAALLPAEPVWLDQVHGVRVVRADQAAPGCSADAAYTESRGTVCAVLTADCLPVLLCDAAGSVVACAHAGWRGLCEGVIEASVAAMGRPGAQLLAYLGPAIGPASFEVGEEVRAAFVARDSSAALAFAPGRPGKWWCDLYALARQRLAHCGVGAVWGGGFDTFAEATRFYSYRRDGRTGRMAALVWLR